MRSARSLQLSVALLAACAVMLPAAAEPVATEGTPTLRRFGGDLVVNQLSPGVWIFVAFRETEEGKRIPANGLVVTTGQMSILIDTGWTEDQTRRLLDWAATTLGQPVEHAIVTHAHKDRSGGLAALARLPIFVHGHRYTATLHPQFGESEMHLTFAGLERLDLGGETLELFYPGPGHAPDNIVVWLERRGILFAGCLVRAREASSLGFVEEADLERWPAAVRRVIQRYREARILVPGHGQPAGVDLLSHTMELLEERSEKPAPEALSRSR